MISETNFLSLSDINLKYYFSIENKFNFNNHKILDLYYLVQLENIKIS